MSTSIDTKDEHREDVQIVTGIPDQRGNRLYLEVGRVYRANGAISKITLSRDIPGPHCRLWQLRAYIGDRLVWEGPLHGVEGISYIGNPPR